jgi:hypothetical protein
VGPEQSESIPSELLDLSNVPLRELGTLASPEMNEALRAAVAKVTSGDDEVQAQRDESWRAPARSGPAQPASAS